MNTPELLIVALLLDAVFGEPNWLWSRLPHPAVLMGKLVDLFDRRMNQGAFKRLKGCACTALLVLIAGLTGLVLSWGGPIVEVCCAAILLAQKSLVLHVTAVADGLRQSLEKGKSAVRMIVSRDTRDMSEDQVARAAIESAAENLSDGVIAPAFWFLVAGLPGICIYKIVNTADSMIGYRTERHAEFGWASARLDDILNLVPARLTAIMIAALGLVTDIRGIVRDANRHRSPNAGWPEAAMSRSLGIALAGPRIYDGVLQDLAWVHPSGRKSLSAVDIDKSVAILWKTWSLSLVVLVTIAMLT